MRKLPTTPRRWMVILHIGFVSFFIGGKTVKAGQKEWTAPPLWYNRASLH
ncbi:hypothetical protein [Paenibacillus arenilitoris]|uniref:Uncharacterized protein n=1 Tax=Paenibacillus arenilitoris TaxID=2772299 RepID=A0A927CLV3_9BACL|nr:hypothetical protein [Paenibacillus arenilitoris]MBD2869197.1 hypothetical protein [Paenibacillus arenilitoris]